MTKHARTTSKTPDLDSPYSVIVRIMLYSVVASLALYAVFAIIFAIASSWGDPFNYNLAMIGAVMAALLAFSIMSLRQELESSKFMGFM